jgi:hypothetical protein
MAHMAEGDEDVEYDAALFRDVHEGLESDTEDEEEENEVVKMYEED